LEALFMRDLSEVANNLFENLLNMHASPLDEETVALTQKMINEKFPPEDIINLLLNSAVKLRYLLVQKTGDEFRFSRLEEFLVFDDKRAGAAGEALSNKKGKMMSVLVPRDEDERSVYEDTMRWEDMLLKTYSALLEFGIAPSLYPQAMQTNE